MEKNLNSMAGLLCPEILNLNVAKIANMDNIENYEFSSIEEMMDFVNNNIYPEDEVINNTVFLVTTGDELFVTECIFYAVDHLEWLYYNYPSMGDSQTYSIHEYPSFEEAYAVALSIKEGETKLCYSSETKDSPYWKGATKSFIDKL
jgi:hypothetical protein